MEYDKALVNKESGVGGVRRTTEEELALYQLAQIVKVWGTDFQTKQFGAISISLLTNGAVVAAGPIVFTLHSDNSLGVRLGCIGTNDSSLIFAVIAEILADKDPEQSATISSLRYFEGNALDRVLSEGLAVVPKTLTTKAHNEETIRIFGRLEDKRFICCLDLELTCWQEGRVSRQQLNQEIIEIGVVVLDLRQNYLVVDKISQTVKPKDNPSLSPFCLSLTGITQSEVDSAPVLTQAIDKLINRIPHKKDFVWACWGNDANLLNKEVSKQLGNASTVPPVTDPRYIDVSVATRAPLDGRVKGQASALARLRLSKEDPAHRALPDALSLARIVETIKVAPIDAMVSESAVYRNLLMARRRALATSFAKSIKVDVQLAEKLLELLAWNPVRARQILSVLGRPGAGSNLKHE